MIPLHLDPAIPLTVPDDVIKRLRRNGNAHKYRARKLNKTIQAINANIADEKMHLPLIKIENVDIIACYIRENWTCPKCFKRVDITKSGRHPDSPVCGHLNNFANGGGHIAGNIFPFHFSCNAAVASGIEVPRGAKVTRARKKYAGIDEKGEPYEEKPSTFNRGRGLKKSNRKLQNRGFQSGSSFKKGKPNVRIDD